MEYKKQELSSGWLAAQFISVNNFSITKPVWQDTFWEDFFLGSAPSLEGYNLSITNVLDVVDINGDEVVLSNPSGDELKVSINWSTKFTWVKWESERALVMRGAYEQLLTGTIISVWEWYPIKDTNDAFAFWYIKLQLSVSPSVWDYVTFTSNSTNLQWISTEIHYIQDWFVYVRGTNLYWTLPIAGETITIHNRIGDIFVTAEKHRVIALDSAWTVLELYKCKDDDEIIDIERYNGTLFILTKNFVFYWRTLVNCNMNVHPLDFFDNMAGGTRVLSFGKHLVLFWDDNQIISPVNGTSGSLWYITTWLNFNHHLYSKYSAFTSQWSLYILQEDKEFVKVDIVSVSNWEYDLIATDAMVEVRWMLDDIEWEVFITKSDKYISIINQKLDWTSIVYAYNTSYNHWVTWTYDKQVRSLWDYLYWVTQFTKWEEIMDQSISFHLGWDNLTHMKTCFFVKMLFVAEEDRVPDYTLTIDKYIGWMKYTRDVALKDYPINNKILRNSNVLWYEEFWDVSLSAPVEVDDLGYIINLTVRVNETADMFIFTLKNNNNKLTYGWSVIGYRNWLPEVTAYDYIIKS